MSDLSAAAPPPATPDNVESRSGANRTLWGDVRY